jgi:hypothetical protein
MKMLFSDVVVLVYEFRQTRSHTLVPFVSTLGDIGESSALTVNAMVLLAR